MWRKLVVVRRIRFPWRYSRNPGTPVTLRVYDAHDLQPARVIQEHPPHFAERRPRGAADTLRPLHHLWLRGARSAGRGGRTGARQARRQNRSASPRALAVPHGRRFGIAALRLPRAAGTLVEENQPSTLRYPALSSSRGPRHRFDEQNARLSTSG